MRSVVRNALFACLLLGLAPRPVAATCNVIPSTRPEVPPYRGVLGSIDRPFASPGDFVTIRVRKAEGLCDHERSAGLADYDGLNGVDARDVFVSVLFEPVASFADPGAAVRNVVVLTPDCTLLDLASHKVCSGGERNALSCNSDPNCPGGVCVTKQVACEDRLSSIGPGAVACIQAEPGDIQVIAGGVDEDEIRFRFPNTDAILAPNGDDRTLAGPATIVVTPITRALPCGLAAAFPPIGATDLGRCANVGGQIACVDELFDVNGSCSMDPREIVAGQPNGNATFPYFTALPPPNGFEQVCDSGELAGDCDGQKLELRFAVDRDGNALAPMNYAAIRKTKGGFPIARLVNIGLSIDPFPGLPTEELRVPISGCENAGSFVRSFAPEGYEVSPLVSPLANLSAIFGSADANAGVVRVQRRGDAFEQCQGGTVSGAPCNCDAQCTGGGSCGAPTCIGGSANGAACPSGDGDCPLGQCGPAVIDATQFVVSGIGPGVLTDGQVDLSTEGHVPLEGLFVSDALLAFATSERDKEHQPSDPDPNGDGDWTDSIVTVIDRASGNKVQLGDTQGVMARAVAMVRKGLARFPAIELEDDIVAYLEPEALQGNVDRNGDGDTGDTILRVYRIGPGGTKTEIAPPGAPFAADAGSIMDGRPFRLSGGLVFYRTLEWMNAPWRNERLSIGAPQFGALEGDADSALRDASPDHRWVVFESASSTFFGGHNGTTNVLLRDRGEPRSVADQLYRVSRSWNDVLANGPSSGGAVTDDGCQVAFLSHATNLVPGDNNGASDIFVRIADANQDGLCDWSNDRTTRRVSLTAGDVAITDPDILLRGISGDGRYVFFESAVDGIVPGDNNGVRDVFARDRNVDGDSLFDVPGDDSTTVRLSVAPNGAQVAAATSGVALPFEATGEAIDFASGRHLILNGDAALAGEAPGTPIDVIRDRDADGNGTFDEIGSTSTARSCLTSGGSIADDPSCVGSNLTPDGAHVMLGSQASDLDPGANATHDYAIFARDRDPDGDGLFDEPGETSVERVDVSSDGSTGLALPSPGGQSEDGRYVSFETDATLTAGDDGAWPDVYVRDRWAGTTQRASLSSNDGNPTIPSQPGYGYRGYRVSRDGTEVLFDAAATNLVTSDNNTKRDVFARHVNPAACSFDLNGDCDLADPLVLALDSNAPSQAPVDIGRVSNMSLSHGIMAYVRSTDHLVRIATDPMSSVSQSLNRYAEQVVLSAEEPPLMRLAALASEAIEGENWNGDTDETDLVPFVTPAQTSPSWTGAGSAADSIAFAGDSLAFGTREGEQCLPSPASCSIDADADRADRILRIWDGASTTTDVVDESGRPQPIQDFVVGGPPDHLIALRTREGELCDARAGAVTEANCRTAPPGCSAVSTCDLNADGDCCDDVLQVWDQNEAKLWNTGRPVLPCNAESCDERVPYRVNGRTVSFLTLELKQNDPEVAGNPPVDLNGDGDALDVLIHTYTAPGDPTVPAPLPRFAAQTSAGRCSKSFLPCAVASECGASEECVVPPGICFEDVGSPAPYTSEDPSLIPCPVNFFGAFGCPIGDACVFVQPFSWYCHETGDVCDPDQPCGDGFSCREDASLGMQQPLDAIVASAAGAFRDGRQLFYGKGLCIESLSATCVPDGPNTCGSGLYCGSDGHCQRQHGTCNKQADCGCSEPDPADCIVQCTATEIATMGASDYDVDGVADPIDNCLDEPNESQQDDDADEIGDACDEQICGNGDVEGNAGDPAAEECDNGPDTPFDDCDPACQLLESECTDGVDNDGDMLVDFPADPACVSAAPLARENPQCANGKDDDDDGIVDFAGGDPQCKQIYDDDERSNPPSGCGLGAELSALLLLLGLMRGRHSLQP